MHFIILFHTSFVMDCVCNIIFTISQLEVFKRTGTENRTRIAQFGTRIETGTGQGTVSPINVPMIRNGHI